MSNNGWTQNDELTDWDKVDTEAPPTLPNDLYIGVVAKAEPQLTKKSSKPSVKVEVTAQTVFQGDELPTPRKLTDIVTVTREAAFKVKQLAQSAQVDPPTSNGYDALTEWAASLVGQTIIFGTKQESYVKDGETRTAARVDRYYTAEQAEKKRSGGAAAPDAAPAADAPQAAAGGRRRRGS